MRAIATGLLAAMAAVFAAASLGQRRWPELAAGLAYVRAFAEAGMVGACADWFAVTALFRRPFGLPIPHTAIIPRNKDRIGQALGGFIADNFLTEAVLQERLRELEVARWGGAWLQTPANARRLAARITFVLPDVVAAAPAGLFGELAGSAVLAAIRATPGAPTLGRVLDGLRREGHAEAMVEWAITAASAYLGEHRDRIQDEMSARSGWLSRWFDRAVAGRVVDRVIANLHDMRAPDHRLRRLARILLARWIKRLRTDPELQARGEALKQQALAHPAFLAQVAELQATFETRALRELLADRRALASRLEGAIASLGRWLAENAAARERLNAWARELATGVIAPRRRQIGHFVADVVAGWDATSVTEKLELQVGRDLQYIRINGTLVGGLVGLLIFALARALGLD